MIRRSIFIALVMLVAYHFLLPRLPEKFHRINGQQRSNYDRAQHYLLKVPATTNVIVGSSMALVLDEKVLGPDWTKLTFPGGNLLTGLEILRRAQRHPPVVLIEINVLRLDTDPELLSDLFSPIFSQPRRRSAIFTEDGRPSNYVAGFTEACLIRVDQAAASLSKRRPSNTTAAWEQVLADMMASNRKLWNEPPPPDALKRRLDELAAQVAYLRSGGTTCIFFEMPADASLVELASPVAIRKAALERFPAPEFHWLAFEKRPYQTRDGVHLTPEESTLLTQSMLNQVNAIVARDGAKAEAAHKAESGR